LVAVTSGLLFTSEQPNQMLMNVFLCMLPIFSV
jgi:hypothetical protein